MIEMTKTAKEFSPLGSANIKKDKNGIKITWKSKHIHLENAINFGAWIPNLQKFLEEAVKQGLTTPTKPRPSNKNNKQPRPLCSHHRGCKHSTQGHSGTSVTGDKTTTNSVHKCNTTTNSVIEITPSATTPKCVQPCHHQARTSKVDQPKAQTSVSWSITTAIPSVGLPGFQQHQCHKPTSLAEPQGDSSNISDTNVPMDLSIIKDNDGNRLKEQEQIMSTGRTGVTTKTLEHTGERNVVPLTTTCSGVSPTLEHTLDKTVVPGTTICQGVTQTLQHTVDQSVAQGTTICSGVAHTLEHTSNNDIDPVTRCPGVTQALEYTSNKNVDPVTRCSGATQTLEYISNKNVDPVTRCSGATQTLEYTSNKNVDPVARCPHVTQTLEHTVDRSMESVLPSKSSKLRGYTISDILTKTTESVQVTACKPQQPNRPVCTNHCTNHNQAAIAHLMKTFPPQLFKDEDVTLQVNRHPPVVIKPPSRVQGLTVNNRNRQNTTTVSPAPLPYLPAFHPSMVPVPSPLPEKPVLRAWSVPRGIILTWDMPESSQIHDVTKYQLYAYQQGSIEPSPEHWKKASEVDALKLPIACLLTTLKQGYTYHFAVRAMDKHQRFGPFSNTGSVHLKTKLS